MKVELGRPVAATLLFGAFVSLAGLSIGASWADLSSVEAERDAKADFVSRGLSAVRRPADAPQAQAPVRLFVAADSETLAAAQIDSLVRSIASEAGGTVLSSRADVKHDDTGPGGRIEVQVALEAQNDELQTILHKIETGAPMMLIDDIELQPVSGQAEEGVGVASPRLHAALTLSAYWKVPQR